MAFSINIPGPKLIDLGLYGKLSDIGSAFKESRDEALAKDVFANMRSDDPASVDEALQRLAHTKYAPIIQRIAESHQQAKERAATQDIARGHLGVSQANLKIQQDLQEQAKKDRESFDKLWGGMEPATPAAPTAPAAPKPVFPELLEPPPGPGAALQNMQPGEGYDISAAKRTSAVGAPATEAPTPSPPSLANMSQEQAMRLLAHPGVPDSFKKAIEFRLRQIEAERKEEGKDKEAESLGTARGKTLNETFGEIRDQEQRANRNLYNIERQQQLIKETPTGFGSGVANWIDRAMVGTEELQRNRLGFSSPFMGNLYENAKKRAANYDELRGLQTLSVYDMLQGFGKGTTNEERKVMAQAYADSAKTTEGNLASLRFLKRVSELDKEESALVRRYYAHQQQTGQNIKQEDIDILRNRVREKGNAELRRQYEIDRKNNQVAEVAGSDKKTEPTAVPSPAGAPDAEGWTPIPGGGRIRVKP
jgi:hypothetical protein